MSRPPPTTHSGLMCLQTDPTFFLRSRHAPSFLLCQCAQCGLCVSTGVCLSVGHLYAERPGCQQFCRIRVRVRIPPGLQAKNGHKQSEESETCPWSDLDMSKIVQIYKSRMCVAFSSHVHTRIFFARLLSLSMQRPHTCPPPGIVQFGVLMEPRVNGS